MTRAILLIKAEDLLIDAHDQRERIALEQPARLPSAQLMFDDVFRAWALIESHKKAPTGKRELEIEARLTRALLLSEALNSEVQ